MLSAYAVLTAKQLLHQCFLIFSLTTALTHLQLSVESFLLPVQTEELVKEVDFASAFTFVYSPRQGTKAAEMENRIPEEVQKDRIMRLVELVNSLTRKKSETYIGKTVEILCEDYDEKKGLYMGRDELGRMGYFKSDTNKVGEFVVLKITEANGISLYGEEVSK